MSGGYPTVTRFNPAHKSVLHLSPWTEAEVGSLSLCPGDRTQHPEGLHLHIYYPTQYKHLHTSIRASTLRGLQYWFLKLNQFKTWIQALEHLVHKIVFLWQFAE